MSMKKWTDEELISTRDNLESWNKRSNNSGSKMWLFTAILGAFAVSTGVVFIFFDGIDVLSILLIIMGTITCISWYKSEKQRKDNIAFLGEINREIKSRKIKVEPKSKYKTNDQANEVERAESTEMNITKSATEAMNSEKIKEKSDK
ncbi:hypothetical protein [Nitrosomonas supralitoralis]|uniref:Uncharacterized protein n=1 Tax=Nitrosomonas supralitoralis TaxID=2116706 RepID=A0A2P7NYQ8_9PROT|nr:hypothetical protein [Nitrosomonas supralitoralis]PSJ18582.1 hypothetical protein C7H79_01960 [Nitrosomonas supralitoralis]